MGKTFFFFFCTLVHLAIKHCLNIYLSDEIIWPVIRRKELSLPPEDLHSLHIIATFSLQAANRSTQSIEQLHTDVKKKKAKKGVKKRRQLHYLIYILSKINSTLNY